MEDFACDEAFEAADDFALPESFGGAAGEVGAGWFVVAHAGDDDQVEG